MSRTPSKMRELGTSIPSFNLPDVVSGKSISSESLAGRPAVVIFICNHCPYVKHIREGLAAFGKMCLDRGVAMLAISSNDAVAYPADGPEAMVIEAQSSGYVFPYLFDESQDVARAFDAACTPDLYIYDVHGTLAYRGQFDDSRPNSPAPVTGSDARAAIDALLSGQSPTSDQKPSIGCNIKWKLH